MHTMNSWASKRVRLIPAKAEKRIRRWVRSTRASRVQACHTQIPIRAVLNLKPLLQNFFHFFRCIVWHYIKALPKSCMYIIHEKYSNDAYTKILTFKTLSKFLGGYHMRSCVKRIILVEKNMAIDIFGFAPGHPSCTVWDTLWVTQLMP